LKIQKRLLVSILPVVFITVLAVTVVATVISKNVLEKQVKENAQLLSTSYSNQLNAKINLIKRMAVDLSAAIETAVNVETVLINTRKRYPDILRIWYTDIYGTVNDMTPYNRDIYKQKYKITSDWSIAKDEQKVVISNPLEVNGEKVFYIYSPVTLNYVVNAPPTTVGVAIIIIPVEYMFETLGDVVFGKTGSVFVVNEAGTFISHKDTSYIMNKKIVDLSNKDNLQPIQNAMVTQKSGIGTYYTEKNRNLISFSPVSSVNWSLAITASYQEFTREIDSVIAFSLLILMIALLLAVIVIYLIVHSVTLPITNLSIVADKISEGDFSIRSNLKINNEIGKLSASFDLMVDRLEDYNRILEIEVQDRTKELMAANEELEATNEELAATNEALDLSAKEMEAMNEELKVTNETLDQNAREMEAMNEELKVTNENMEAINEELVQTVDELDKSNKQLAETKDALWSEMELAKKLQTVLLPKDPRIEGFDVSAFMNPTSSVGGDYYDVINVDGKDWFLIGDVSGHGVTSGLIMMMVQTAIHVALSQKNLNNPVDLLTTINRTIHANISKLGGKRYMTLTVFACLDGSRFSFAGAHLPVIIYRKMTDTLEMLETPGAWVGLVDDVHGYNKLTVFNMQPGDTLLLYTDGISEAIMDNGEQFTQERLAKLFKECVHLDSKGICEVIREYSEKLTVDDDVTVMVVKKV